MSEFTHKFIFKPLVGDFSLDRVPVSGGGASGTVSNGILTLPGGVEFEIVDGLAMTGDGEILLEAGSTITITAVT
jgi:hypothetical protein